MSLPKTLFYLLTLLERVWIFSLRVPGVLLRCTTYTFFYGTLFGILLIVLYIFWVYLAFIPFYRALVTSRNDVSYILFFKESWQFNAPPLNWGWFHFFGIFHVLLMDLGRTSGSYFFLDDVLSKKWSPRKAMGVLLAMNHKSNGSIDYSWMILLCLLLL